MPLRSRGCSPVHVEDLLALDGEQAGEDTFRQAGPWDGTVGMRGRVEGDVGSVGWSSQVRVNGIGGG